MARKLGDVIITIRQRGGSYPPMPGSDLGSSVLVCEYQVVDDDLAEPKKTKSVDAPSLGKSVADVCAALEADLRADEKI